MSAGMPANQVLSYEARWRPRIAVVAGASAVLLMAGAILQLTGHHPKVSELTLTLISENSRFARDLVGAILTALGVIGVGGTLVFLWGAARARNPQTQPYIRILAIVGSALSAIGGVGILVGFGVVAHEFVTSGSQSYQQANRLTGGALPVLQTVGLAGQLLLAMGIVLVALAAMRVGLLTRFMGYFGMFVGALFLFGFIPIPVIQSYWLAALAYLLFDRWPTAVPRAWSTGRAEPWPSAQEVREQRIRAQGARGGSREKPVAEPVGAGARRSGGSDAGESASARPAPHSGQKRKRKRRK
jgi:hypothetical protein